MARVVWAPQALADLEAIGDFIAPEAPHFAQVLTDGAFEAVERLELFPRSGQMVPEIGDESIREVLYRGFHIQ
jgi:toxin ParE1/3/4